MKKIILLLFLTPILNETTAQFQLTPTFGVHSYIAKPADYPIEIFWGFSTAPDLNIAGHDDFSISISTPVNIALNFSRRDPLVYYKDRMTLGFQAGATGNINIGYGATKNSTADFGWFFGTGWQYAFLDIEYRNNPEFASSSNGPLFHTGLRFPAGDFGIAIKAFYYHDVKKGALNIYGLTLEAMFMGKKHISKTKTS